MVSLADLASRVNRHVCRDIERLGGMFVTMFLVLIDVENHKLVSVNAGHPPGYLFQGAGLEKLKTGGTFIGQFADLEYTEAINKIGPGDRLIVFTDGHVEQNIDWQLNCPVLWLLPPNHNRDFQPPVGRKIVIQN